MKRAMLAVSFGVSDPLVEEKCIIPLEDALKHEFPAHELRRAYTSRVIREKLLVRGIAVEGPEEAIQRLEKDGFEEIVILPSFILPGGEYARLRKMAGKWPVAETLLHTPDDLCWMARLLEEIAAEEGCPLLAMAHGSGEETDDHILALRKEINGPVFIACLHGNCGLDSLMDKVDMLPDKKITLMPLMLAAGNHARIHMAGEDASSWKSRLEKKGWDVRCRMQGLGEMEKVRRRFVEKAARAIGR